MDGDGEEVGDAEWLLRRVQEDRGPTAVDPRPSPEAFRPDRKRDVDGLSLFRESLIDARALAERGRSGKRYFVARLRAGWLRELGMTIEPKPDVSGIPGHVVIPELNSATRKQSEQETWQWRMAELADVVGPFAGAVDAT